MEAMGQRLQQEENAARLPRSITLPRRNAGFSVLGPSGKRSYKTCPGVFVAKIQLGSFAEQTGLHVGDRIQAVDGTDVADATAEKVVDLVRKGRSSNKTLTLLVEYDHEGFTRQCAFHDHPTEVTPVALRSL